MTEVPTILDVKTDQTDQLGALFEALAAAQGEMESARKDSNNPHFNSKYADLASVWDAARGPLSKNKLSVVQTTRGGGDGSITVITTLGHASGQWMRGEITLRAQKPDAQGIGSATTYGRRFGLSAITGIAPDDDDGNAASAKPEPKKQAPKQTAPQPTNTAPTPTYSYVNWEGEVINIPGLAPFMDAVENILDDDKQPEDYFTAFAETNIEALTKYRDDVTAKAKTVPGNAKAQEQKDRLRKIVFRLEDILNPPPDHTPLSA